MEHMEDFWQNVDNPDLGQSVTSVLGYSGALGGGQYPAGSEKKGQVFPSAGNGLIWALPAVDARTNANARYRMYGRMIEATWFTIEEKKKEGSCGG